MPNTQQMFTHRLFKSNSLRNYLDRLVLIANVTNGSLSRGSVRVNKQPTYLDIFNHTICGSYINHTIITGIT